MAKTKPHPGKTPPAQRPDDVLDLDQAIAFLKTTRPTFYRWLRGGKFKGLKVGRQWRFRREDIERFLQGQEPPVELPADIKPLLAELRERLAATGLDAAPRHADNPIAEAVDLMIRLGGRLRASDLHLEPQVDATGQHRAILRLRLDGVLQLQAGFDVRLLGLLAAHWKRLGGCDVRETQRPQDGRLLGEIDGRHLDLRICTVPAVMGEAVTARFLDSADVQLALDRMDFAPANRQRIDEALREPAGVILLTGPTGSGKTSVLYACLMAVAKPGCKTITIEDPVEYFLPNMMQVQINSAAGMTFASTMRACLRCDPDVVMISEIRDCESLEVLFQMALTGHLTFSSLHTEDAASTLGRIVDIGFPANVAADAIRLIVSQRLVRVLCPDCRQPVELDGTQRALAENLCRQGGLVLEALNPQFHKAVGCAKCNRTGYRGRTLIAETMVMSGELAAAWRRGAGTDELRTIAVRHGMTTIAADGFRRAAAGQTTIEEVCRVLNPSLLR
ncbi:MAG: ATPase, T2SS/T4P/T4SS family [Phycisphaerae bacterium]